VPYDIGYDEPASDHMYNDPESLEAQCHSGFFHREYGHTRTILVSVAHDMTCGSGPDTFYAAYHGRLNNITKYKPANHTTVIIAYLIFLRRGILDQMLVMLFPV
jgi:hypothetical protein